MGTKLQKLIHHNLDLQIKLKKNKNFTKMLRKKIRNQKNENQNEENKTWQIELDEE